MMKTPTTPTSEKGAGAGIRRSSTATMRVCSASEVFRILEPAPAKPTAAIPSGLWKTGWLPQGEGAAS